MRNMLPSHPDPQQKKVLHVYAALAAGTVFCFLPFLSAQAFGMCLITAVLLYAYFLRSRSAEDSLQKNHMIFIIRTIWIASLLFGIGTVAGGLYAAQSVDRSAIDMMITGGATDPYDAFRLFIDDNWNLLMISSFVAVGPGLAYFLFRLIQGLSRALKGYRIARPNAWL